MNTESLRTAVEANRHMAIEPSILYFGTPVVLLSTENEDGSFNLAPMSSAWALEMDPLIPTLAGHVELGAQPGDVDAFFSLGGGEARLVLELPEQRFQPDDVGGVP